MAVTRDGVGDVEEHLAHRVGRVVDLPTEREPDASGGEVVADRAGIRHRASQPVQFRHDEGVPGADGGEGLVQSGAVSFRAGESVVEVDPVVRYAELAQPVMLR